MPVHKYNMGIIGNCSYIGYINQHADVKWMCLPKFDSSFLFGSLLDEKKGGHADTFGDMKDEKKKDEKGK